MVDILDDIRVNLKAMDTNNDGSLQKNEFLDHIKKGIERRGEFFPSEKDMLKECSYAPEARTELSAFTKTIQKASNLPWISLKFDCNDKLNQKIDTGVTADAADITNNDVCATLKDAQKQLSSLPVKPVVVGITLPAK